MEKTTKSTIKEMSGSELELKIMELAISTKPDNFDTTCVAIQELLDEQNLRAKKIAKKYKKVFINRTVAEVFGRYWLENKIYNSMEA